MPGNNSIVVVKIDGTKIETDHIDGLAVDFHGENNSIEVYEPVAFTNSFIETRDNLRVTIRAHSSVNNLRISKMWGSVRPYPASGVAIGSNFTCNGAQMFVSPDEGNICIGNDCMFSFGITLAVSDGHIILDKKNRKILNRNKDILIGDHVWIGMNATILKGVHIGDNSVVGAHSVVAKRYKEGNIIIAGNPAGIVKKNIEWKRENYGEYMNIPAAERYS
ncbi:MAG: acyltransferase [Treponema sp.]|jgi:acetyltransferase-like isoleucine patch superfamily enzyme|nr:acyltransferase [Treponema sp.]